MLNFFFVCAITVGGLTSPLRGPYAQPLYFEEKPPDYPPLNHGSLDYDKEQRGSAQPGITAATDLKKWAYHCEETEAEETKPSSPCCPQISEPNHKRSNKTSTVPELELRKLERGALFSVTVIVTVIVLKLLTHFNLILWHLLQIFTWPACLSFTLRRSRSSCCPASAATPTPTGNWGTKRWPTTTHTFKKSNVAFSAILDFSLKKTLPPGRLPKAGSAHGTGCIKSVLVSHQCQFCDITKGCFQDVSGMT